MRLFFCFMFLLCATAVHADTLSVVPPKGWERIRDPEQLPQKVSVIYIGSGKSPFSPSINLATEETTLPVNEYMTLAKSYHIAQANTHCKQLGTIDTNAGKANLLQIDRPTQWGPVRFIQGVIVQDEKAFVVTATCLQEEFASLSAQIFKSIQSFTISQ